MPRVQIEHVVFFIGCAACGWVEGPAQRPQPAGPTTFTTDLGNANAGQASPDGESSDGLEDVSVVCQSQLFGADPLSPEESTQSCSRALAISVLNPANVVVKIAGQVRAPGDGEDGWQLLEDGMTVLLLGLACDEVIAGADLELSALCE